MHGVFDASFLFFHLGLGRCAYIYNCDTTDELGKPFLELLFVVIRGGLFGLGLDLLYPTGDRFRISCAFDDSGVLFIDVDLSCPAEVGKLYVLKLQTEIFGDDLSAREHCDVFEHRLSPVAESGCLNGAHLDGPAELINNERCKGLAFDIFGNDEERLAHLCGLLEDRKKVLHARDLFVMDEDVCIVKDAFHPVCIGDEIR